MQNRSATRGGKRGGVGVESETVAPKWGAWGSDEGLVGTGCDGLQAW